MERFEHGGDVYGHPGVIDFSASLNPFGMPDSARRALVEGVDLFCHYPDPASRELSAAIARFEGVREEWVLTCAGATDAFSRLCQALRPERALVCAPTYSGYEQALCQVGCKVVRHELVASEGFRVTDELVEAITPRVQLAFIANPNNPTGTCVSQDVLVSCLERAKARGAVVVLDECFIDLTPYGGSNDLLGRYDNLVIVKALTKTFALAGLRVGYALSSNALLLARMRDAGQPWAISTPAQLAGVACLGDDSYLAESRAYIKEERVRLACALAECGMDVVPSDANYLLFHGPCGLYEALLGKGFLVRPCDNFHGLGEGWFRSAVRMRADDDALLGAVREVCR